MSRLTGVYALLRSSLLAYLVLYSIISVAEELPVVLQNSWWLQNSNPGSIFNSKKAFDHLQFNNKEELVIAVIDTGIDFNHPFLKEHHYIKNDKSFDFNFYTGTNNKQDLIDRIGHGTHVAGTIIAAIKKINPKANIKLISLKILPDPEPLRKSMSAKKVIRKDPDQFGYYTKEAAIYLTKLKNSGVNVVAVNASYGGHSFDENEFSAVKTLLENDILLIAAAGNDGRFVSKKGAKFYPATYATKLPGIISVGNISKNGDLHKSSNFGALVSILAPGEKILSTKAGGGYREDTGTSMATPQVTAAVSLLKALHPNFSSLEIKNYLLKNSRFNTAYLAKTGAATRLDMNLLFRPKATKYKFSKLPNLAKENFVNLEAKITKDTACIKAPANKILCGTAIYDKFLEIEGKQQSIKDISAKHNLESLKNSYYQLDAGGRIIESSLGSLIHSFSKNDKIYQRMLTSGFSFKDLYLNLGTGMLDRYYEGHIIIPVLSKREFLKHYPFSISKKQDGARAYAKYIEGLINSPPQFLDRIGPLYMQRKTPLTRVEAQLVQSFPLPVTSYIAGFLTQRRTPDMINVVKSMKPSDLNNKALKNERNQIKKMQEMLPTMTLSKSDIRYIEGLKQAGNRLAKSLSSSLGGRTSLQSGLSPMEKSFRKETEKTLAKPIVISKVAGALPIDKNQKTIPVVDKSYSSQYQIAEALLNHSVAKMRNKIAQKENGASSPLTHFQTNYVLKDKKIRSKMHPELRDKKIREFRKQYDQESTRQAQLRLKEISKSRENYFAIKKMEGERSPGSKEESESAFFADNMYANSIRNESPKKPIPHFPGQKETVEVLNPIIETNETFSEQYSPEESFLCSPERYDLLFDQLDKDINSNTPHLTTIFCEKPNKIPDLKQASETMKHYNLCKTKKNTRNKNFYELIRGGSRASECDTQELITPCGERMKRDLIKICNQNLPSNMRYKMNAPIGTFLDQCFAEAKRVPDIDYSAIDIGIELGEFIQEVQDIERINCSTVSSRKFKVNESFNLLFKKIIDKIKLSYEAKKSWNVLLSEPKNVKAVCTHQQNLVKEIKLDNMNRIETSFTLKAQLAREEDSKENSSQNKFEAISKTWLLTNRRLEKAKNFLYSCSKKTRNNSFPNSVNSQ